VERSEGLSGEMKERPELGSGEVHLNDRLWVLGTRGQGAASAQQATIQSLYQLLNTGHTFIAA
jgi:hypothetical protein